MADIKGALFERDAGRGPRFTGVIEIGGEKIKIAVWEKTSAKGNPYFQISEDKRQSPSGGAASSSYGGGGAGGYRQQRPAAGSDMDDDIPF